MTAGSAASVGMEAIGETVERFGIMDHMPREYSMALGAGETTPLRHDRGLRDARQRRQADHPDPDRPGAGPRRQDDLPRRQRPCEGCNNVDWQQQPVPVIPDTREQIADPGSAFRW